jgi:cytochrome b6-f complex iron-sulfur subunit
VKRETLSPSRATRREFCIHACQFASLVATGTVAACGGSPTSPSAPSLTTVTVTVSGRTVSVPVDGSSVLATAGGAALAQTSVGTFLLSRTGQDSFTVLTATCTHEGCTVSGFASDQYVCPCHGSRYTTAGAVVNGPATRALQQFASQFTSGVVTFMA